MRLFRNAWPNTAAVVLVVLFATPWPGGPAEASSWQPEIISTEPVKVDIESPNRAVRDELKDMVEVTVKRSRPSYDGQTGQARWPHWIGVKNKSTKYALHLTLLQRQVRNGLEMRFGADATAAVSRREFKLDMLRADLHIEPTLEGFWAPPADDGPPTIHNLLWFPCTEKIGRPGGTAERNWQGTYSVWRTYTGDVTWGPAVASQESGFAAVKISFRIDFDLVEMARSLPTENEREKARRSLEWGRFSEICETCRALIICESLRQSGLFGSGDVKTFSKSWPWAPKKSVHLSVGLEKRSVTVDPSLAERKRTIFCTFWRDSKGKTLAPIVTDGTEEGLAEDAPYLTFRHAVRPEYLAKGETPWTVEARTGEVLDAPVDARGPGPWNSRDANEKWETREAELLEKCTTIVWQGKFSVQ